jgi:DNA-directed RNA polymerase subunit RPC12/RpoP
MAEHNEHRLFTEMRTRCVNKLVDDKDLYIEWQQHGQPCYIDCSSNCICGVRIQCEFSMINKLNGEIITPVGSTCILKTIGKSYKCHNCHKRFIDEIPQPAMARRMTEQDWVCRACHKETTTAVNALNQLHDLEEANKDNSIYNRTFKVASENDYWYQWCLSRYKLTPDMRSFIRYYLHKQKLLKKTRVTLKRIDTPCMIQDW